jgi:CRP-like cAMP-binding protein
MRADAPTELLRKVWLFERCSRSELSLIAKTATPVDVGAGKVLAREGEAGREFFVIKSGCVEASRGGNRIGVLRTGNFFGEMALLDRQPRAATVVAVEPTELLVLTPQQFTAIVETMPSVDRKIMSVLASRVRELEERFLPEAQIVGSGDRGASVKTATRAAGGG